MPKNRLLDRLFQKLEVDIAVVTETWLKVERDFDKDLLDLKHGVGISALTLNRAPNPNTGVAHGGVAVLYKKE